MTLHKLLTFIRLLAITWIILTLTPRIALTEMVTSDDLKDVNSRFFRYINAYIVSSALYSEAVKTNQTLHFVCDQEYQILPGEITALQPISFAPNLLHPVSGIWHHRYTITRCNKSITYNTYVIANNGDLPVIISGLIGGSNIPFSSLFDTIVAVYKYINYHYAPCPESSTNPQPFVYNTEVLHNKTENDFQWQERWSISMCNSIIPLTISMHNKDGKFSYQLETSP